MGHIEELEEARASWFGFPWCLHYSGGWRGPSVRMRALGIPEYLLPRPNTPADDL